MVHRDDAARPRDGGGFTGYSLPDDLLSGVGISIAYSVVLSIPVFGVYAAFFPSGGDFPTANIISRLAFMHVLLLPVLILGVRALHLAIIWPQKRTQFRGVGRTENNVVGSSIWPNYAMKSVELRRGIALCGSGVGASVAANKIPGVRAGLIHDVFSAHQGVAGDDMNVFCLGGKVIGSALELELIERFLCAQFSGAPRHKRRIAKVHALEERAEEFGQHGAFAIRAARLGN